MKQPFVRDQFTWLAYFMVGFYAYMISVLGPAVPFLRSELQINYTVSAFYLSGFAAGLVVAGFTGARLTLRFGRAPLFWGGGLGMAIGGIVLTLGRSAEVGILGTFLMSVFGSYMLVVIQSALSSHHGNNRAFALTESNVLAVLAASVAPIAVGFGEAQGLTWRIGVYVGIVFWGLLFIWTRRKITLPDAPTNDQTIKGSSPKTSKLPRAFWSYWVVVFFAVSVEWCIVFWASTYMETVVGLTKEAAATSVTLFTVAQFVGRAAGSWLTRRYSSSNLLLIAGAVMLVGFPLFWLGRLPLINAVGLFICGLGVANLFPLTLSLTSTVGLNNPDAASGYTSMGSGLAILLTPQLLGILADRIGIQTAFGIVAPLGIAIIIVTVYANKLAREHAVSLLVAGEV